VGPAQRQLDASANVGLHGGYVIFYKVPPQIQNKDKTNIKGETRATSVNGHQDVSLPIYFRVGFAQLAFVFVPMLIFSSFRPFFTICHMPQLNLPRL